MKVCYFGTYRAGYNRNNIMIAALKSAGVEVLECHENLWTSIEDRENITKGGWRNPAFWWRVIKAYVKLFFRSFAIGKFDIMVLGYPGQFDTFLGKIVCFFRGKPLVLDVLMSLYLVAMERKLDNSRHSAVNFLFRIEKTVLKIPDLLIHDTPQYVAWLSDTFGVEPNRFRLVPIGADDSIFKPVEQVSVNKEKFKVLYYGTFIPNHGLKHIVEAAKLLSNQSDIEITFIGEGPEKSRIVEFVEENSLENVQFLPWCSQEELVEKINGADVCLGAFGSTPQSLMTVQNKIYECMACGKTIINGTSPAIIGQFTDEVELKICERNAEAIAEAILYLKSKPDLVVSIGARARQTFLDNYSIEALGKTYRGHLEDLMAKWK